MSNDERDAYENLVLLCPNHHRLIDRLEPEAHPVERHGDAFDITLLPTNDGPEQAFVRSREKPERLSPGARYVAGHIAKTFGNAGPHALEARWRGPSGEAYEGVYPI